MSKRPPSWGRYSPEEAEAFVIKLAKEGHPPSEIGVLLRDQYGIPLVKLVAGKSMKEMIEGAGMKADVPEDLNNLLQKAAGLRSHLSKNKADSVNKRGLELITSKIRHLAKYYKKQGLLPRDWEYKPETTIVV